eukprot:scaffold27874_cov135-Isochrysis_galbana.AAC.1
MAWTAWRVQPSAPQGVRCGLCSYTLLHASKSSSSPDSDVEVSEDSEVEALGANLSSEAGPTLVALELGQQSGREPAASKPHVAHGSPEAPSSHSPRSRYAETEVHSRKAAVQSRPSGIQEQITM